MGKPRAKTTAQGTYEPLNLVNVPQYTPTLEQFADPLAFINSIREEAEKYGLCRIRPPAGWKPPYAIDRDTYTFRTRVQTVNELMKRVNMGSSKQFWDEYNAFLKSNGVTHKPPVFAGLELDLHQLYDAVEKRGGSQRVTNSKRWKEVSRVLKISDSSTNASFALRQLYQKHLASFEAGRSSKQKKGTKVAASNKSERAQGSKEPQRVKMSKESKDAAAAAAAATLDDVKDDVKQEVDLDDFDALAGLLALDNRVPTEVPPAKRAKLEQALSSKPDTEPSELMDISEENLEVRLDQMCELCAQGTHEEVMILCDKCDCGYHMYCLAPPMEEIPEGDWFCPRCIAVEKNAVDLGFLSGQDYNLRDFERMANDFKAKFFAPRLAAGKTVSPLDIEQEFWRIVEKGDQLVEVLYGADLDTAVGGSGFPKQGDSPYVKSNWNLNNFPRLSGEYPSLLRHVRCPLKNCPHEVCPHVNISGVMVPWLYVGMVFSSFCWHYEDHMFYSINYHHWGEPKVWYCVPADAAEAFENVFKEVMPDLFAAQPDLLMQLVTMLTPRVLLEHGVPVYRAIQEEGDFMITFPRSYHGGFNCGFNCAEAVNFAPPDWARFGYTGVERYRFFRRSSVLSLEELLCDVADAAESPEEAVWVLPEDRITDVQMLHGAEVARMLKEETELRYHLVNSGVNKYKHLECKVGLSEDADEDLQCSICRYYVHLGAVVCDCDPERVACLHHSVQLCDCAPHKRTMLWRHSLAHLESLVHKVTAVATRSTSVPQVAAATMAALPAPPSLSDCPTRATKLQLWFEAAESLLAQSNPSEDPLEDARRLQEQAHEFAWGGREMQRVFELAARLKAAVEWGEELGLCLRSAPGGFGAGKLRMERLADLLQVQPPPLRLPQLEEARQLHVAALEMVGKLQECLETKPRPLPSVLQKLVGEAQRLQATAPFDLSPPSSLADCPAAFGAC
eukprot:gene7771-9237_t